MNATSQGPVVKSVRILKEATSVCVLMVTEENQTKEHAKLLVRKPFIVNHSNDELS